MGKEINLLEYTTEWTRLVNRGLFEINTTFMLFREIEMVRKHLYIAFERSTSMDCSRRETVICAVADGENVQFYWTMFSVDIESEEQAVKLLKEIGLWVTIQGFSIAGTWTEQYIQASKSATSKIRDSGKNLRGSLRPLQNHSLIVKFVVYRLNEFCGS